MPWPPPFSGAGRSPLGARASHPEGGNFAEGAMSGDPAPDAITLWTRVSDVEGSGTVELEVARDRRLSGVVAHDLVRTSAASLWSVGAPRGHRRPRGVLVPLFDPAAQARWGVFAPRFPPTRASRWLCLLLARSTPSLLQRAQPPGPKTSTSWSAWATTSMRRAYTPGTPSPPFASTRSAMPRRSSSIGPVRLHRSEGSAAQGALAVPDDLDLGRPRGARQLRRRSGAHGRPDARQALHRRRRAAAYRPYFESMPTFAVKQQQPHLPRASLRPTVDLILLDQRQYRADQPCGDPQLGPAWRPIDSQHASGA